MGSLELWRNGPMCMACVEWVIQTTRDAQVNRNNDIAIFRIRFLYHIIGIKATAGPSSSHSQTSRPTIDGTNCIRNYCSSTAM